LGGTGPIAHHACCLATADVVRTHLTGICPAVCRSHAFHALKGRCVSNRSTAGLGTVSISQAADTEAASRVAVSIWTSSTLRVACAGCHAPIGYCVASLVGARAVSGCQALHAGVGGLIATRSVGGAISVRGALDARIRGQVAGAPTSGRTIGVAKASDASMGCRVAIGQWRRTGRI
jgi:hypothetical protein